MHSVTRLFATLSTILVVSPAVAEELPSCEAKIASYIDDSSARTAPDLAASDYAAVLNRGTYLSECGVPSSMAVKVCAAVQDGAAVGVTITTDPADAEVAACVRGQVGALEFPSHPKMDVVRTTFAADDVEKPRLPPSAAPTPEPPAVAPKRSGCGCSVPSSTEASFGASCFIILGSIVLQRRRRHPTR